MTGQYRHKGLDRRKFVALTTMGATLAWLAPAVRAQGIRARYQADGANLPRLGIVVAGHDWNPESEMAAMNRGHASIFASRMPIRFTREFLTDPTHADAAVDLLRGLRPRVIMCGSTSTSYLLGVEGENRFRTRMETRTGGIPFVLPATALAEAARAFGVRRIFLVHPPWFNDENHAQGCAYFQARGFDVLSCERITPSRDFSEVAAEEVHRWIVANMPREAEAVIQGGNGLRAVGAITALEASLRRPVITANQALFWYGLRLAGAAPRIDDYGRLFTRLGRA